MQQLVGRCQDQHRLPGQPRRLRRAARTPGRCRSAHQGSAPASAGRARCRPAATNGQPAVLVSAASAAAAQGRRLLRPPAERGQHVHSLRQPIGRHHDVHVVHRPQIDRAAERRNDPGALQHDDRDARPRRGAPAPGAPDAAASGCAPSTCGECPACVAAKDRRSRCAPDCAGPAAAICSSHSRCRRCRARRARPRRPPRPRSVQQGGAQQMHVLAGQPGPRLRRIEHTPHPPHHGARRIPC